MRGATVPLNCIHPNALSYQPKMKEILKDLHIDTVRFGGGIEGGIWGIDMGLNPDTWADNLYYLMDVIGNLGVKASFQELGNGWFTMLGITQPQPTGPDPMTPIDTALQRIDMLAGNNKLGYDFINDPRIWAWCVANEIDISVSNDLYWCLAVADRIRSYGGKAYIACPRYEIWGKGRYLSVVYPLIAGHVDYLAFHQYMIYELVNDYNGVLTSEYIESYFNELKTQVDYCNEIGWPLDKFIFEEFGIWLDHGIDMGVEFTFSDETREQYYRMALNTARNLGIKNIFNHQLHEQTNKTLYPEPQATNYAIVAFDGSYYLPAYELKNTYATLIFPWSSIITLIGPLIIGLSLIMKTPRRG